MKKNNYSVWALLFMCIFVAVLSGSCGKKSDTGKNTTENITTTEENTSGIEVESTAYEEASSENETTTTVPFWMDEEYAHFIKPGEAKGFSIDIDNDGEDERVELVGTEPEYPELLPDTRLRVMDGDIKVFESSNFFYHFYNSAPLTYYIVNKNGKNYLLEYMNIVHQGEDARFFELMEFKSDNTYKVVEKESADMSVSGYGIVEQGEFKTVHDNLNFRDKIMAYLDDDKTILVSDFDWDFDNFIYSVEGNLKKADDRIEMDLYAHTLWDCEGDTFEEKLRAYYEQWYKAYNQ